MSSSAPAETNSTSNGEHCKPAQFHGELRNLPSVASYETTNLAMLELCERFSYIAGSRCRSCGDLSPSTPGLSPEGFPQEGQGVILSTRATVEVALLG